MSKPIHLQHTIAAPPSRVFGALTGARDLESWFAEHADIDIAHRRYDFWGRFTPETPDREDGHHRIEAVEQNRRLSYVWKLRGEDTLVDIRLQSDGEGTTLGLWHNNVPSIPQGQPDCYSMGDIWWLWLENLRRYAEGRTVTRCDFSTDREGDVVQSIEIDGSPEDVWHALTDPEYRNRWIASGGVEELKLGENWIDWGPGEGGLKVVDVELGKSFAMEWVIEGSPTVVTWTLEGTGNRTRLTLAHSGFAPDRRSDGEWGGWINYLSLVRSVVEYGAQWMPPIQEIVSGAAMYYAVSVWERQEELLENSEAAWTT